MSIIMQDLAEADPAWTLVDIFEGVDDRRRADRRASGARLEAMGASERIKEPDEGLKR